MSKRPVFSPMSSAPFILGSQIEFIGISGFSADSRQQNLSNFQDAIQRVLKSDQPTLEISSISDSELGRSLSALNLEVELECPAKTPEAPPVKRRRTVESWYQSAKVLDADTPIQFEELAELSGKQAKNAIELKTMALECKQLGITHDHPLEWKTNIKRLTIKAQIHQLKETVLHTLNIPDNACLFLLGDTRHTTPTIARESCLQAGVEPQLVDALFEHTQNNKLTPMLKNALQQSKLPDYLRPAQSVIFAMPQGLEWFVHEEYTGDINKWSEAELNQTLQTLNVEGTPIEQCSKKIVLKKKREMLLSCLHHHILQLAHRTMDLRQFRTFHSKLRSLDDEPTLERFMGNKLILETLSDTVLKNIVEKIRTHRTHKLRRQYHEVLQQQYPHIVFKRLSEIEQFEKIQSVRTLEHTGLPSTLLGYYLKQIQRHITDAPLQTLIQEMDAWITELCEGTDQVLLQTVLDDLLHYTLPHPVETVGYQLNGEAWPVKHPEAIFTWLYFKALQQHPEYLEQLAHFQAFTDVFYNPYVTINCQARAAALAVQLHAFEQMTIREDASWKPPTFSQVMASKADFIAFCKQVPFGKVGSA